jgi:pimeloyl-ACP methyl ester carboxylesterase
MTEGKARYTMSVDGTRIAYWCAGRGDPILIIHGLGSGHSSYEPLVETLSSGLLACNMDRRGRGESGDTMPYALEREFEDVAAVATQLGQAVVLGYSIGGPAAIEAARTAEAVRAVILFEAWDSPLSRIPADVFDGIEHLVSQGRYEEAFNYGDSPEEIEESRQLPDYADRVAMVHLTPREIRGWQRYWNEHPVDDERWAELAKPVLFLVSEANRDGMLAPAQQFAKRLPQATVRVLEGIGHRAYREAPDVLASVISSWIGSLAAWI